MRGYFLDWRSLDIYGQGWARRAAGWGPSRCDGPRRVQRRELFVHLADFSQPLRLYAEAFRPLERGRALPQGPLSLSKGPARPTQGMAQRLYLSRFCRSAYRTNAPRPEKR